VGASAAALNDAGSTGGEEHPRPQLPGDSQWPLWEVFVQPPGAGPHEHAGSVHAPDAESALQNARRRRGEAKNDKPYRHPQFYKAPRGVRI
jgi:ring-1,2-phenylacetyl-CoA epoxidase subunit PaaB